MSDRNANVIFEIGEFRVDPVKRLLLRGTRPLPVTSKAFDTLIALLDGRGTTISKTELMQAVWADTAVEENNLTQQISALRKAFGERAGDHRYIVTVPGRGYSFVAEVSVTRPLEVARAAVRPARSAFFDRGALVGGGLAAAYIFVVCLAMLFSGAFGKLTGERRQSVAVLTFRAVDETDQQLGVGIRDTLRARLGSVEDITVRFESDDARRQDAVTAGRLLHADVVLSGSVQRDRDRVRVAVELVDVSGERIVWGKTFDEAGADIFRLQDRIASEVAAVLLYSRSAVRLPELKIPSRLT